MLNEIQMEKLQAIGEGVKSEFERAFAKFGAFNTAHEGWAILREEVDELWDEVKSKDRSLEAMREEATQVAAMAIRFIYDLCD